ncbi:MAG: hypothetical protein BIFFINMI_02555 [Phycisphaerae bacterium]|nr:hypothetical protein [Phycisphaerae bacterium]
MGQQEFAGDLLAGHAGDAVQPGGAGGVQAGGGRRVDHVGDRLVGVGRWVVQQRHAAGALLGQRVGLVGQPRQRLLVGVGRLEILERLGQGLAGRADRLAHQAGDLVPANLVRRRQDVAEGRLARQPGRQFVQPVELRAQAGDAVGQRIDQRLRRAVAASDLKLELTEFVAQIVGRPRQDRELPADLKRPQRTGVVRQQPDGVGPAEPLGLRGLGVGDVHRVGVVQQHGDVPRRAGARADADDRLGQHDQQEQQQKQPQARQQDAGGAADFAALALVERKHQHDPDPADQDQQPPGPARVEDQFMLHRSGTVSPFMHVHRGNGECRVSNVE